MFFQQYVKDLLLITVHVYRPNVVSKILQKSFYTGTNPQALPSEKYLYHKPVEVYCDFRISVLFKWKWANIVIGMTCMCDRPVLLLSQAPSPTLDTSVSRINGLSNWGKAKYRN